jgi:predicted phosphodiesterase
MTGATGETTVVLSDIHANGRSLRRAIELARTTEVTRWVILGDLLTYGIDVDEVLDVVEGLCAEQGAVLVRGNHDQLYQDLAAGDDAYYRDLPEWIRESVDDTLARLDTSRFARLPWSEDVVIGDTLFSHANPFGDWRYLSDEASLAAAAERVVERGSRIGVFGHVHRHRAWVGTGTAGTLHTAPKVTIGQGQSAAITAGSVGQPRDAGAAPSFLRLAFDGETYTAERAEIDFDVAGHVAALAAAPLSEPTRAKLVGFFAPA